MIIALIQNDPGCVGKKRYRHHDIQKELKWFSDNIAVSCRCHKDTKCPEDWNQQIDQQ